jgi:hypothetical protein
MSTTNSRWPRRNFIDAGKKFDMRPHQSMEAGYANDDYELMIDSNSIAVKVESNLSIRRRRASRSRAPDV